MSDKISDDLTKLMETVNVDHIQSDEHLLQEISTLLKQVNVGCAELMEYINGISK